MALSPASQQQNCFPVVMGAVQKTAFTFAAISSTPVVVNAPPGIYRFFVYAVITTAQSSDTLTVNAIWTDDFQANTVAILSAVSTTSQGYFQGQSVIENTATANINYSVSTTATTAVGNIYIVVERVF
jgi:hypothetical protein